jgi:hypothetical protein
MALSDYPSGKSLPTREAVLQALAAVGKQADGAPLDFAKLERLEDETLVGLLDAVIGDLAEKTAQGPGGRGKGRRMLVFVGRQKYVKSGPRSMEEHFQLRTQSLASDMQTWLNHRAIIS